MRPINDLLQSILSKKVKQYGSKLSYSMIKDNVNETEKTKTETPTVGRSTKIKKISFSDLTS